MKTTTKEVKTYVIEWVCDQDDCDGLMEQTGDFMGDRYLHECNKCGETKYSDETYPKAKVEYVELEGKEQCKS